MDSKPQAMMLVISVLAPSVEEARVVTTVHVHEVTRNRFFTEEGGGKEIQESSQVFSKTYPRF